MTATAAPIVSLDGARDAGFDPNKLARAFTLLDGWVQEGVLPGAGALVARAGRVAGEHYVGLARRQQRQPVSSQTVWSLASVTKPFTATAVMLLVEAGLISLDEPLYHLLPEFMDVPAEPYGRQHVTLRHCLAHCSGLPGFSPNNLALRRAHRPLEEFVWDYGLSPLLFPPGSAHLYSNPGILLAAEVVGRAVTGTLGQRLERPAVGAYHEFVRQRILQPLGMQDTTFAPDPVWEDRVAWVEETGQEGQDYEMANSAYYRSLGIPWGGLFSTPRDLARFVDLFLPTAAGTPRLSVLGTETFPSLVSPATAQAMIAVQFAPPDAPATVAPELRDAAAASPLRPAVEWGIGWEVKGSKRPHRAGELTSAATYTHSGATGTMVWADPATEIVCVLLTNRTLVSGWPSQRARQSLFSNAVAAAAR